MNESGLILVFSSKKIYKQTGLAEKDSQTSLCIKKHMKNNIFHIESYDF
jgi:hypothetical protein